MLQLTNIKKEYPTGGSTVKALRGVDVAFRNNEFVSILGPSGCGKTTLLNIIGGLDRYSEGDLLIRGRSTKEYTDRDWDTYRNHSIGFVFQSYNLIPHQSILANVELALTIAGMDRSERRKRAKKALEQVGLGDQLHKKPNQMSGGQMQRVAIARALVNDPDILLADEPTGALDTETSIQVMELLKAVAKDRLVIMVTHNPELAAQYSTRIVKLRDGKIVDDSDPYVVEKETHSVSDSRGKSKMSFLTSLSLSFNNLKTKKGRTFLTSFAGSIGIIGIALILALSNGVNSYITDIQKETMSSYPLTIDAETIDLSSVMGLHMSQLEQNEEEQAESRDGVYADYQTLQSLQAVNTSITENDLTSFKQYLEDPDSEIQQYLGENGVIYSYDVDFSVYAYDSDGNLINTNTDPDDATDSQTAASGVAAIMKNNMTTMMGLDSNAENFSELMPGTGDQAVSAVVTDNYDLLYGSWPENYDEVVLILNQNNGIQAGVLYQLGLITGTQYKEIVDTIEADETAEQLVWDYETICEHPFYLVSACDAYQENADGTFTYIGEDSTQTDALLENSVELKISGIVRANSEDANANLTTAVGYTSKLTDYLITHTDESAVVKAQEADDQTNVLTGMAFEAASDSEKIEDAKAYIAEMGVSDKASLYRLILYVNAMDTETNSGEADTALPSSADEAALGMTDISGMTGVSGMTGISGMTGGTSMADESSLAAALDYWLANTPDDEILLSLYDQYISGSSYEENLKNFGKVSYDAPDSISIYVDSFEDKDAIADCIAAYNRSVDENQQITYTDYVALLTSSITTIVNVISYVLIAFVAVSLIVSCIMIGIITHISVLERTKEIGILRALGASKHNISQVFNAETVIIGFCSGFLGVGISMLLTIPINAIIQHLIGSGTVKATLPVAAAILLVLLSVAITVLGGLLPAKKAARKDPVTALRTE